jgi:hypothetical protein
MKNFSGEFFESELGSIVSNVFDYIRCDFNNNDLKFDELNNEQYETFITYLGDEIYLMTLSLNESEIMEILTHFIEEKDTSDSIYDYDRVLENDNLLNEDLETKRKVIEYLLNTYSLEQDLGKYLN